MTDQELKDLVARLAVSQKESEESTREMKASINALSRTVDNYIARQDIADEKIQAHIDLHEQRYERMQAHQEKLGEKMQAHIETQEKLNEKMQAHIETQEKLNERMQAHMEAHEKSQKELNERMKDQIEEYKRRSIKSDRKFEKLTLSARQARRLGINIGYDAEDFFFDSFRLNRYLGDIKFDDISQNVKGKTFEFDIVLYNSTLIGIVEVKHRLRRNEISEFIKKIPRFKEEFPQFEKFNIYAGVASYSFDQKSNELAKKRGLYVFSRYGHRLKPLHGDEFTAKVF